MLKAEADNIFALQIRGQSYYQLGMSIIDTTAMQLRMLFLTINKCHCRYHLDMLSFTGEIESAMNHYRKGLKYDPEHEGCKKAYRTVKKVQGMTTLEYLLFILSL